MRHANREELEAYLRNVGKRSLNTFSTLGKLKPFVDLIESDFGVMFIGDQVNRYSELLEKISNLEASDEEKMEFKVLKNFLINISTKLTQYDKCVSTIKDTKKPR